MEQDRFIAFLSLPLSLPPPPLSPPLPLSTGGAGGPAHRGATNEVEKHVLSSSARRGMRVGGAPRPFHVGLAGLPALPPRRSRLQAAALAEVDDRFHKCLAHKQKVVSKKGRQAEDGQEGWLTNRRRSKRTVDKQKKV
jgi:hypothetical protein